MARDIIVIGASAGGIAALSDVLKGIHPDFPGSVFIVLHTARVSHLPNILRRTTSLAVDHAVDGQRIEPGKIVIAPPDQHLLFNNHHVVLSRGPKQNNVRPAIDPLFRSAARMYRQRVVGVVLSGMLDDGSAGLLAIKQAGGVTIVQQLDDALHHDMPRNAMAAVEPDYVLPASEIGGKLNQLAKIRTKRGGSMPASKSQQQKRVEVGETDPDVRPPGKPSSLTCPECGGTLWEVRQGNLLRFLCHTGHEYSSESRSEAQNDNVEAAMWVALRSVKERAMLLKKLGTEARREHRSHSAERYEKEAKEFEGRAEMLQRVLLGSENSS